MSDADLTTLAARIRRDIKPILQRWRQAVRELPSARHLDVPTLNDHLPLLLEELAEAFATCSVETIAETLRDGSPPEHGSQRLQDGFDIVEVVAEYSILRRCVHDFADANGISLQRQAVRILDRVLDQAIGFAVQAFAVEQAAGVQRRREEYLAFVAHDLRTPLNAMALAVRVLDATTSSNSTPPETARMLRALHRNVGQLSNLVSKILDESSHLDADQGVKLERRVLDLWPLIEGLVQDVHPLTAAGSTRIVNEVSDDIVVFADASVLRRVFQNLIANAITYTPNGTVHIGAHARVVDGSIECWVSDSGTGIPAELLATVFEKGAGDGEKRDSTGLGLAIVKTFVEAHGGTVHAESVIGRGTTIRLTLPAKAS